MNKNEKYFSEIWEIVATNFISILVQKNPTAR